MPVIIRKSPKGGWDIVEEATGVIKGHSKTMKKAKISAGFRNKYIKRNQRKPQRRRPKK